MSKFDGDRARERAMDCLEGAQGGCDDDRARLLKARSVMRRVIDATMSADDCKPRGAFRARDASTCDALIDAYALIDVVCKGTDPSISPRAFGKVH